MSKLLFNCFSLSLGSLAVSVALMFPGNAQSQILKGDISMARSFGYWQSYVVTLNNDKKQSKTARIASVSLDSNIVLALDTKQPHCQSTISLILPFTRPAERDVVRQDILLSLRTDSGRRFEMNAASFTSMGDDTAIIMINAKEQLSALIAEMLNGSLLRVKVTFGHNERNTSYLTFSLRGFSAAFTRMMQQCFQELKPNETYAPNEPDSSLDNMI